MSDLLTQMNASAAARNSEAAVKEAKAARSAAEERLESSGLNPFVTLEIRELESVGVPATSLLGQIFGSSKEKISDKVSQKVSVKRTDISYLEEKTDDFGTPYTVVNLEDRCELEYSSVEVAGTLEENQTRLNS